MIGIGAVVAVALWLLMVFLQLYGVYLGFKKKWYIGAVSLLLPGFAPVVGAAKFLFNKNILK